MLCAISRMTLMQTWSVKKTLSYLMSGELRSEKIQQRGGERRHCADSSNPLVFCFVFRAPCHQMTMMTMRTMIVVTVTMKATRAAIPIAKQMTVLHVHKTNKLENTSSRSSMWGIEDDARDGGAQLMAPPSV